MLLLSVKLIKRLLDFKFNPVSKFKSLAKLLKKV